MSMLDIYLKESTIEIDKVHNSIMCNCDNVSLMQYQCMTEGVGDIISAIIEKILDMILEIQEFIRRILANKDIKKIISIVENDKTIGSKKIGYYDVKDLCSNLRIMYATLYRKENSAEYFYKYEKKFIDSLVKIGAIPKNMRSTISDNPNAIIAFIRDIKTFKNYIPTSKIKSTAQSQLKLIEDFESSLKHSVQKDATLDSKLVKEYSNCVRIFTVVVNVSIGNMLKEARVLINNTREKKIKDRGEFDDMRLLNKANKYSSISKQSKN